MLYDMAERQKKRHLIGYARVSTDDQNLQLQRDALIAAGVDPRDIYEEKISGKSLKRPQFQLMWKDLRKGDALVIWKLDRLSRDAGQLWRLVEQIHERGCDLIVIAPPIDARTSSGRLVFGVLASVAQFERELGVERTKAGLAAAKAKGRTGGQPKKITDEEARDAYRRMQAGENVKDIAAAHPLKPSAQAYFNRFKLLHLSPEPEGAIDGIEPLEEE